MRLQEISAALKQRFRPVFRGGIEDERSRMTALAVQIREQADEISGAGRAIASVIEGKGE